MIYITIMEKFSKQNILYLPLSFGSIEHTSTLTDLPSRLHWCGHESYVKGTFRERKGFDFYEIIYTKFGSGVLYYQNEKITCCPGQLVIINTQFPHHYEVNGDLWQFKYLQVYGQTAKFFYNLIFKNGFSVINPAKIEVLESLLDEIITASQAISEQTDIDICVLIDRLFAHIYAEMFTIINKDDPYMFKTKIKRTLTYINENYTQNLKIDRLMQIAGLNRPNFYEYFKKITGQTPYNYILTLKINKSKFFLQTQTICIAALSKQLGYKNEQNFQREFKKITGLTPLSYRKKYYIEI